MRSRNTPRASARGFTLMEMVIVLLIIAVGSALVVPLVEGGFTAREVRRAAREIAATFSHCRGEAVSRGAPQDVVIDPTRNTIYATDMGHWAVLTDRAVIERVEGGVPAPTASFGAMRISCYPNGSTTGADVVLCSRADRMRERLWVHLDPLLGTVRVQDAPR